jgi:hypothetical protein
LPSPFAATRATSYLGELPGHGSRASCPTDAPPAASQLQHACGPLGASDVPAAAAGEFKWTTSLLKSSPRMQQVVGTLLELATLPPHASLHAGKVSVSLTSECQHGVGAGASTLLLLAQQGVDAARYRTMVRVCVWGGGVRCVGASPCRWRVGLLGKCCQHAMHSFGTPCAALLAPGRAHGRRRGLGV